MLRQFWAVLVVAKRRKQVQVVCGGLVRCCRCRAGEGGPRHRLGLSSSWFELFIYVY